MKVPLLDLNKQHMPIINEIKNAINRVITSQNFILGEEVELFENAIAKYCNVKYAVGVSSGSDAIIISLMASNIGPGDFVITSPYSFFATAEAVSRVGAKLIFVDIDMNTFNIDSTKIEELMINSNFITKNIRAIIPIHLFGQCADMGYIYQTAKDYNLKIIEDACQAIGSEYRGMRAGTIGDFGCFSFFPSKNLGAFGDGGLVVTESKYLYDKLKILRQHGSSPKYYHKYIGGNFRLDSIQAAILRVKLKYLDEWMDIRRKNAKNYEMLFNEHAFDISLPHDIEHGHSYNQYVIVVLNKRDELRQFLYNNEIQTEVYYPIPLHKQECYLIDQKDEIFPISEYISKHSLALPIYPGITFQQQMYIVKKIKEFYS